MIGQNDWQYAHWLAAGGPAVRADGAGIRPAVRRGGAFKLAKAGIEDARSLFRQEARRDLQNHDATIQRRKRVACRKPCWRHCLRRQCQSEGAGPPRQMVRCSAAHLVLIVEAEVVDIPTQTEGCVATATDQESHQIVEPTGPFAQRSAAAGMPNFSVSSTRADKNEAPSQRPPHRPGRL